MSERRCKCGRTKVCVMCHPFLERIKRVNTEQELTFAEAIKLVDESARDIEFRCKDGDWAILTKRTQLTVEQFANWEFRRAKPKRSRVQEMAEETEAVISDPRWTPKQAWMTHAISAVCEWLRKEGAYYSSDEVTAERLEREFLEPR